jgi:hypothetical protein
VAFERLAAGYDAAYRRAERLARDARDRGDDATGNPSTEVYLLTDSIDEDGAQRRTRPTMAHDHSRAKSRGRRGTRQAPGRAGVARAESADTATDRDERLAVFDDEPDN